MECPDGDQDAPHPVEFADCKNAHADEDEHGHAGDDAVFGAACHALPAHVGFKIVFVQARADKPAVQTFAAAGKTERCQ